MTWQELDNISSPESEAFYKGDYASIYKATKEKAEKGDVHAAFRLGLMKDKSLHRFTCNGYEPQHKCKIKYLTPENFEQNNKRARYWYTKATEMGHPYARYFLIRQRVPKQVKKALNSLKPYVELKDGVATFMHNSMNGAIFISRDSTIARNNRVKQRLNEVALVLKSEADEGRVLAMFYLGLTYFWMQEHAESLAWFHVASEKGYQLANGYKPTLLRYIEQDKQEEEALQRINELSDKYLIKR